jgi:hypothetical protein
VPGKKVSPFKKVKPLNHARKGFTFVKNETFKKLTPTFGSSLPAGVDELMFTTTNQNG